MNLRNINLYFTFRLTSLELINQGTRKNTVSFVKILPFIASWKIANRELVTVCSSFNDSRIFINIFLLVF